MGASCSRARYPCFAVYHYYAGQPSFVDQQSLNQKKITPMSTWDENTSIKFQREQLGKNQTINFYSS
ncbi:MAG: hypothetical protein F6K24_14730 [Okeania sp. SIO2D1]|nr:hypothetical protein [Okeania sp. SIO2D1]